MQPAVSVKIDKANVEHILGLTSTQEGMLFHYVSDPDQSYYVEQLYLDISSAVNHSAFRKAWGTVARINEMLRVVFRWDKLEHPVQIILKEHPLSITERDYSEFPLEEAQILAEQSRLEDRMQGFDLETAPLRIHLFKLRADRYQMSLTWHHILFDGWSNGILIQEFLEAYTAHASSIEFISQPKTSFKEFLRWKQAQDLEQQQFFWTEQLQGVEGATALPEEGHLNAETVGNIDKVIRSFSLEDTTRMNDFAKQYDITMASFLYSIWGLLLQKYNHTEDVLFGTTVSGREPSIRGIEQMVGLFINTIPLRIQSSTEMQGADYVQSVDRHLKRREPFEHTGLSSILACTDAVAPSELISSIVVLENYPLDLTLLDRGPLAINHYQMEESTHYGLTLGIQMWREVEVELAYDTKRFTSQMIQRMAGHFQHLAMQIVNDPNRKLRDITIVTDEESDQILHHFNRKIMASDKGFIIHSVIEEQARIAASQTAVVYAGRSYTYLELNHHANLWARKLKKLGVTKNTYVAIVLERSFECIVAMLGVLKAGGAYIPIDHEYTLSRIQSIVLDSGCSYVLTALDRQLDLHFPGTVIEVSSVSVDLPLETDWDTNLELAIHPDDAAYVIYTSGSTGMPKGVVTEHQQVMAYVAAFQDEFKLNSKDVFLQQSSCSFDQFVEEVYPALCVGAKIVIASKLEVMDVGKLIPMIQTHGITRVSCSPLLLNELNGLEGLSQVQTWISGGDVLKPEYISNLTQHARIYNTYGPTEATVCATYYECPSSLPSHSVRVPIGRPILNYRVYILNEQNQLMPIGLAGEICIAGAGVARGYLHQPDQTRHRFVLDPQEEETTDLRMYRTGDLGRWLENGQIEFLGRNDEQVKIRGYRIETGEVEHHLITHPEVQEAVVLPEVDGHGMQILAAYIVTETVVRAQQLRSFLAEHLPSYMIPSLFYGVGGIPKTVNGKIDKKSLRDKGNLLLLEQHLEMSEQIPLTPTQAQVRKLWQEVLKFDDVGLHEPFFEMGGNSILLMQLHAKLAKTYEFSIAITDLFAYPTIATLSQWLDQQGDGIDESVLISYQALPAVFFDPKPLHTGLGTIRIELEGKWMEHIQAIASEHHIPCTDVLLSVWMYVMAEISGMKRVVVQYTQEEGNQVVPLVMDLSDLHDFGTLFRQLNEQRIDAMQQSYERSRLQATRLTKSKHSILPLFGVNLNFVIDVDVLEHYDIVLRIDGNLGMNENMYQDYMDLICTFNDRRLSKRRIQGLMESYVDLLQQIAASFVPSGEVDVR
ncbi:amino acid adenylation domain-containing protein [Paenibacillus shirakamiensis]|uniref:Amino acid adenylation domain-containing protein n=1 Tax=Paenibacillus shirakamiensis TaxID=1265935 RepID=A0ABS4JJ21_9BACL|nr:non-ribosomal peptide synthetase [Paenibacillus shirakamiensis]MBP2000609.1 amino acid adenylation domain-containing protein [Paenibacillus shirakamiensis]